jgi:hypothetical protein
MTKSNEELQNELNLFKEHNTKSRKLIARLLSCIRENDNIKPIQWNELSTLDSQMHKTIVESGNLESLYPQ